MDSPSMAEIVRILQEMIADGAIQNYAIGGAVAANLWGETLSTLDLDVAVIVPDRGQLELDSLRPVLEWIGAHGLAFDGDHVTIAGVPVQFLAAWHPVVNEAIERAEDVPYGDEPEDPVMRVITATYLVAIWKLPGAYNAKRAERTARLRDDGVIDETLLADIRARHKL